MTSRWRALCQNGKTPHPPEFKSVYAQISTIRGNRFRFRGGNPVEAQRQLEALLEPVSAEVKADMVDGTDELVPAASDAGVNS